ncbi:hypothetical protein ABZ915_21815 [Streptomyces sp. NPDC046915]|uniref:hypothetical protein n=1 Tax=Streptomyces sp. NPDC046915 TaxID=3155257 RepID=UPI00340921A8
MGGILLTPRAVAAGWSRPSLARALRTGGWTRIRYGAWAEPGRNPDLVTQLRAVQLLEPRLIVSHRSAAALWRIETLTGASKAPLEFIDPQLTLRRAGSGVHAYRMPLAALDVAERQGLWLTTPLRTLTDLLRQGPRDEAVVALDSAFSYRDIGGLHRAPLTRPETIAAALATTDRGSTSRAPHWLRLADPLAGSPAETIARLRMHDAGLHPESQAELRTPDGRRRYLDFLFRREGLGVEIEGYAYHGTRDSHRRDILRYNQLIQCPQIRSLLRFSAEVVFHRPAYMVEEIRSALAALTAH